MATREEELLIELASLQDNPLNANIPKELAEEFAQDLRNSGVAAEYLRATMGIDMNRYFGAVSDVDREQIRGHFSFAAYLRGLILKKELEDNKQSSKKQVRKPNGSLQK